MTTLAVSRGNILTLTAPTGGVSSGDVLVHRDTVGVCLNDALATIPVAVAFKGVFALAKSASYSLDEGQRVYWDTANEVCVPWQAGPYVGIVTEAATKAATTCNVRLAGATPAQRGFASWTFDATAGKAIAAHTMDGPYLPRGARITHAYYVVSTTFTDGDDDSATISIGIPTDDAAGIVAATAISGGSNIWDAGGHETIQTGAMANVGEQLTADRKPVATVADDDLTAGKLVLFAEYVVLPYTEA